MRATSELCVYFISKQCVDTYTLMKNTICLKYRLLNKTHCVLEILSLNVKINK